MKWLLYLFALAAIPGLALAQSPSTPAPLAGLSFLVGNWESGDGKVADTGESSKGHSTITREAGGNVLLRRDHTDLFDRSGKPAGSFEQVMMVYTEGGAIHADYADGTHVIHYVGAEVVPGRSVVFKSAVQAGAPSFQLKYKLIDPKTLSVEFGMVPPGGTDFHPIAAGSLKKKSP